jgi:hypothetical protein
MQLYAVRIKRFYRKSFHLHLHLHHKTLMKTIDATIIGSKHNLESLATVSFTIIWLG